MGRAIVALLWCSAILAIAGSDGSAPDPKRVSTNLRCGSHCLYVSLSGLGLWSASFLELENRLGQPSLAGYSLGQLQEFTERNGAHTLAVESDLRRLQRRSRPFTCIALLKENHFVNVYDIDEQYVYVIDPPKDYTLPHDTFRLSWTGKALLISPSPLSANEGWGVAFWASLTAALATVLMTVVTVVVFLMRRSG